MTRDWPRILIVDDNPTGASMMRHFLGATLHSISATERASVTIALSGEMALRLMREDGPFDVVLTDGSMDGMDGIELTRAIRAGETEGAATGTTRHVVIGMLTAWSSEEGQEPALIAGCNFVVLKPVRPDVVIDHIIRALDTSARNE
jgi:CheY-like chemotaxis protein